MDRHKDAASEHQALTGALPTEAEMTAAETTIGSLVTAARAPLAVDLEDAVLTAIQPLARRRAWLRWLPVAASASVVASGAVLLEMVPTGATLASLPRNTLTGAVHAAVVLADGWRTVLVALASVDLPVFARGTAALLLVLGVVSTAGLVRRWRRVAAWRQAD